jgi:thioredoxin reductase (NADPH)
MYGRVGAAARDGVAFRLRVEPSVRGGDTAGRAVSANRDLDLGRSLGEVDVAEAVEVAARSVIIATGVRDQFPRFDGWAECVGRSLFWCIVCDGYETIDRVVAVIGDDEDAATTALELLDFTPHVTLIADRREGFSIQESRLADLAANGIAAHPHRVAEYRNRDGKIDALILDDAARTCVPVEVVFAYRRPIARNEIAIWLGVELNDIGQIVVDGNQLTNVPGVYAAGDVTSPHDHQIAAAVHEGNEAACAANYFLYRPVQKVPAQPEC